MPNYNHAKKEINFKIVYCGPGMAGKTTNLKYLYAHLDEAHHGKLMSIDTANERTLFCDFLPVSVTQVQGYTVRVHLYTVPGQPQYDATRQVVLRGADGVVFVASSVRSKREENLESFENTLLNLRRNHLDPDKIPMVLQYNKRDMPDISTVEELNGYLNSKGRIWKEAVAHQGVGVRDTLHQITSLLIEETLAQFNASHSLLAGARALESAAFTGKGPEAPRRPVAPPPTPARRPDPAAAFFTKTGDRVASPTGPAPAALRPTELRVLRTDKPPSQTNTTTPPPIPPQTAREAMAHILRGHRTPGPLNNVPTPQGVRRPLRRLPTPAPRTPGPLNPTPTPPSMKAAMRKAFGAALRKTGPLQNTPTPGGGTSAGPLARVLTPATRTPGPLKRADSPARRTRGPLDDTPTPVSRTRGPLDDVPTPVS